MGGGRRPGPNYHNPLSRFTAPRTPGPLGCNDAGDPGTLTSRGDTPGCLGLNDDAGFDLNRMVDPIDFDYLVRHHESKSHLVESVRITGLHLKKGVWSKQSIWGVAGGVVFRVPNIVEDMDGSPRAYHPPTAASWDGKSHGGPAKDHLANAVGDPGVTKYAHSKKEEDWALTAGCQLFRDLHKAKTLEAKVTTAGHAAKPPATDQASVDKAAKEAKEAKDAKDALDKIYNDYGVTKLSELVEKSKSAVCVLYIDGRPIADSQADWSNVTTWAGIQTDGSGNRIVRTSGPNTGFYIPAITPGWADAEKHPWVVLNPPEDEFGVKKTNSAVVIKNGDPPTIAYGMVADWGPYGHLGEVSRKMMDDLNFPGDAPSGDYIVVMFPQNVSAADIAKAKQVSTIQADAKAAFEAWSWEGRSGMDLVKELFPTPDQYHRVQNDFADAKKYLTSHIDHLMLKLE